MIISVPKATYPQERRVALVPAALATLAKAGVEALVETGAGLAAGYSDEQYAEKGAKIVPSRRDAYAADVVLEIRAAGANRESGHADLELLRPGLVIIALCDPLGDPQSAAAVGARGATLFSLEMVPRISRAQSMDVLSSQASIAGYRAVLLAATQLPKMFPMMTTAAGTITPAKVFIVGAGVAGLQAVATARRLGAVVSAYDTRPVVKEQVQSLGGKFVELAMNGAASEGAGGYAKAMDEDFYRRQRELMGRVVAENDVVITTAAVPGKQAPTLVTASMVRSMTPGSVIVDVAAERGGNCELTRPGETVVDSGVSILGPTNLPSEVPTHASQMFSKNVLTFLMHLAPEGKLNLDTSDEIIRETLIAQAGEIVHPKVRELLGNGAK